MPADRDDSKNRPLFGLVGMPGFTGVAMLTNKQIRDAAKAGWCAWLLSTLIALTLVGGGFGLMLWLLS